VYSTLHLAEPCCPGSPAASLAHLSNWNPNLPVLEPNINNDATIELLDLPLADIEDAASRCTTAQRRRCVQHPLFSFHPTHLNSNSYSRKMSEEPASIKVSITRWAEGRKQSTRPSYFLTHFCSQRNSPRKRSATFASDVATCFA
jgi:hypothetical protein